MVGQATAVVVCYLTTELDLAWIPPDVEIIVVHNDRSLDPARVQRDRIRHVFSDANVGFGGGVNAALPLVQTDRVVLFNPDTSLTREHWETLVDAGRHEVVTIPIVDRTSAETHSVRRYPTPLAHLLGGYRVGRWLPRQQRLRRWFDAPEAPKPGVDVRFTLATHWSSAAVVSFDTASLRAVDGFDVEYFLYYEDVDLCWRLAEQFPGMQVRLAETSPAVHGVGESAESSTERLRLASAVRWAERQGGAAWRLVARLLRARLRLLSRG